MNKKLKIILIITGIILLLGGGVLFFMRRPPHEDFGTFYKMRTDFLKKAAALNLRERDINTHFENYKMNLGFPVNIIMDTPELGLFLKAYEGPRIRNLVVSQFEFSPGSFMDFTFLIRPHNHYKAPFFFGDILGPLAGVKGSLFMDFYTTDKKEIDIRAFFGDQLDKIEKALNLVKPYQKTDDRGKLTGFLTPYKSPYRMELNEPVNGTDKQREAYFEAVFSAYNLYFEAYIIALNRLESSPDFEAPNARGMAHFVNLLWEKDVAIKLGRMLFAPGELEIYFRRGFWNQPPE